MRLLDGSGMSGDVHVPFCEGLRVQLPWSTHLLRQIALEHELEIITGKVSVDHVHMFIAYPPTVTVSKMMQWLKGISSRVLLQEFPHLRRRFWGRHFWARGYLAVSLGNITDEMIQMYIDEQEGEPVVDDSRFQIDPT